MDGYSVKTERLIKKHKVGPVRGTIAVTFDHDMGGDVGGQNQESIMSPMPSLSPGTCCSLASSVTEAALNDVID